MGLAKDQHLIQTLATHCADQTFRNAILPRRSRRDRPVADTHGFDPGRKDMPVGTVVVAQQISRGTAGPATPPSDAVSPQTTAIVAGRGL